MSTTYGRMRGSTPWCAERWRSSGHRRTSGHSSSRLEVASSWRRRLETRSGESALAATIRARRIPPGGADRTCSDSRSCSVRDRLRRMGSPRGPRLSRARGRNRTSGLRARVGPRPGRPIPNGPPWIRIRKVHEKVGRATTPPRAVQAPLGLPWSRQMGRRESGRLRDGHLARKPRKARFETSQDGSLHTMHRRDSDDRRGARFEKRIDTPSDETPSESDCSRESGYVVGSRLFTRAVSTERSRGLRRKSSAPALAARARALRSSRAVTMITGIPLVASLPFIFSTTS